MKVCEKCGAEIYTKDGDNRCENCEVGSSKRNRSKQLRKQREEVYASLGLTKVRGSLGGTYWE